MLSSGGINKVLKIDDYSVKLETDNGIIIISAISDNILRIRATTSNTLSKRSSFVVDNSAFAKANLTMADKSENINLKTNTLNVNIDKSYSKIIIKDAGDRILLEDFAGAYYYETEKIGFSKKIDANTYYYGIGERLGKFEVRGQKHTLYNIDTLCYALKDQPYLSVPFIMATYINDNSHYAYGLYSDNTHKTEVDFTQEESFSVISDSGELDYYFIFGNTPKEVLKQYTTMTGKMDLPPIWSIGYHQSRYGYKNLKIIKKISDTFIEKKIPCDAIHLDLHYMNDYKVFIWDYKRFPQPPAFLKQLKENHFKIITIIEPGVKKDKTYKIYNEGVENDYFCKRSNDDVYYGKSWPGTMALPDFFKEEVREWWSRLVATFKRMGVSGIWNDMNEPVIKIGARENLENPDLYHTYKEDVYNHKELRNLYANYMAYATKIGLEKEKPNERAFILTRSGFAGIQKYAAVWTGDNISSWKHLRLSIAMLLNLGLSGISFCGADVGGFGYGSNKLLNLLKYFKPSAELYARWIEAACLTPFFRTHTTLNSRNQEPWSFGEKVEAISRKYIKLRYKLMPYLYNCFYISHKYGYPIMRPLFFNYPDDSNTYHIEDEFMLGEDMLIAPVVYKDKDSRDIYLPEGKWIDFNSGKLYEGSKNIHIEAPLDVLPIFIKSTAIIPSYEDFILATEDIKESILIVDAYIDKEISKDKPVHYELYEDDGISKEYLKDNYSISTYKYNYENNTLNFSVKREGNYTPPYKVTKLVLRNLDATVSEIEAFLTIPSDEGKEEVVNKKIVKVTPKINIRTSTGICWFINKEEEDSTDKLNVENYNSNIKKSKKVQENEIIIVIPNKINTRNINFVLYFIGK